MRIAVYSGSFNPLHIGHQAIMEYLTKEKDYDWVYLVVSPKNPIKDSVSAETGEERYHAAVEAVKRHPALHVWVDDIELLMPPPQYTIRTLDALKLREPENDFTLVIGADNLEGFRRWRDYRRILTEYGVVVYPRKGFDLEGIHASLMEECKDYKIDVIDAPMVDISSTRIREGLAAGQNMSEWMM
ncbi:MAG: nicotinate (nicotinamide) nucleotide adenylyltransferase [Bacteroidales bacterium]|nr:nicotinate (nicotinamide) nucleotide adenylyltransferase [Bacteroidales bacterium]